MKRALWFIIAIVAFQHATAAEIWTKILDEPLYTAAVNTSNGFIAGEFNPNTTLNPHNGLLVSKNVGTSWNNLGLQGRGITGVASFGEKLYATTYYVKDGNAGLFASNNKGNTWNHLGPSISATSVAADSKAIYLGGYSHGLWVSKDNGQTFLQKIGTGFYGPKIFTVQSNEKVALAGSTGKTYRSLDNGETWQEITGLSGKQMKYFVFTEDKIFAGSYDNDGLYTSLDSGSTWTKLSSFGTYPVGGLLYYQGYLYAGKYDSVTKVYSIYKSSDLGQSWENTNLNLLSANALVTSINWIYSQPSFIVATVSGFGVYKMEIQIPPIPVFKFLDIPWEAHNNGELVDRIYSFFDHKYPFLSYSANKETATDAVTTVNFMGNEAGEPELYYSSHSGIDFALPYGTEVKAPSGGIASFYSCSDCGYSIKIDHLNGYQTIYMHLQKDNLVTTGAGVPVAKGDILGKVGLTGNTTGPHLHFEVIRDANSNNVFTDDFPQGRVDPFGWLDIMDKDPWNGYKWNDAFGQHIGQESKYLWLADIPQVDKLITQADENAAVTFENKKFTLTNTASLLPYNFSYKSFAEPRLTKQQNLKYIPGTSFILEVYDTLKNRITALQGTIQIEIDLSATPLDNIDEESIKIYYYDLIDKDWKALDTNVDLTSKTVSAETDHLSHFALFANAVDSTAPETTLSISGTQNLGWYTELPTITLNSDAVDLDKIFYSLDKGTTWNEYLAPFQITKGGVSTISYRSSDKLGNYEIPKDFTVKVNSLNKWIKQLNVINGKFTAL